MEILKVIGDFAEAVMHFIVVAALLGTAFSLNEISDRLDEIRKMLEERDER